ncbi:DNA-processing protein DprA [Candidatus Finniella inopinata]|uniref:DNA-protecting protein DprA n=1 Tax=Candidatus Finniella inopinata TaxID=1696036 RepID=A0A4Q7DIA8_9PROT|nr:DNA-processing protein DprA [Candidatus Finniella inopinata]RZI46523.1 DNA-protecting protein DprA [Candidatus Finniella inopinata]
MKTNFKKIHWLQLIRTNGIGPVRFWQFLKQYGSAEQALKFLSKVYPVEKAEAEIQQHHTKGYHLIAAFEPEFPQTLRRQPDCPPFISIYGNINCLNQPMAAIVGARNASLGGRQLSFSIAQELGKAGWQIVSGLARGIDERAHHGALATGTLGVLAGGVDCIYPPEHQNLYHDIAKKGAVISEMPLGTTPMAGLFPRRNRLIAGLSEGVIVIEAANRSGSLITADYALEQGADIFAVPGSPLDPRCAGSNKLLKQGAIVTESAADVLAVIGTPPSLDNQGQPSALPKETYTPDITKNSGDLKQHLLTDLSLTPTDFELLLPLYPQTASVVLGALCELELEGFVQRHAGNKFSRMPNAS